MKKLVWIAVVFVYFLMVWGNLVSSTGSGLACPDWPTCGGTFLPRINFGVFFEWGHRILAATTALLTLLTIIAIHRAPDEGNSALKKSGRWLLVLLGIQILLGGTTVLLGLSVVVSTIHLTVATFLFSGLITVAYVSTWGKPINTPAPSRRMYRLTGTALVGLLIQVALGGIVRHSHAGLACPAFPACLDSFWPMPFTFNTAVAFLHRWWGIAMLGVFVHIAKSARGTDLAKPAGIALGVAMTQVVLGILTVLSVLDTSMRATHAAVGYALWASLFYLALRCGQVRWVWDLSRPEPTSLS